MSVQIHLDNPPSFYTNLDFITGRILLNLTVDDNVSAIIVKLEGESRTALMRPPGAQQNLNPSLMTRRDQRQGLSAENHKILYKVIQVFPSQDPGSGTAVGSAYTLRAGRHEYPFRFKIPFNNGCSDPQSQQMGPGSGFGGFGLGGLQQLQYRHVKRTLPPSLTGFPEEAEIRYYVKVTVQRPSLFKENRRAVVGFKFLPIEPPRPPPSRNEVYARRPYIFQAGMAGPARKSSLFSKAPPQMSDTAPKGEVDARLPSPAILTCNEPIPLRIILRKLNESPEYVFLMSLQVHLVGSTEVRAGDVMRVEPSIWVVRSLNGLAIPIGNPSDKMKTETVLDSKLWDQIPLPNTVAPSFHTCNLTRKYELQVRLGLGFGTPGNIQPQTILLPLSFQIEIYSGISPPPALLDAMTTPPTNPIHSTTPQSATYDPAYPPQLGTISADGMDDAPPSYEDAMADDLAPTDGPRREYSGVTDENAPGMDEKGGARAGALKDGSLHFNGSGRQDRREGGAGGGRSAVV